MSKVYPIRVGLSEPVLLWQGVEHNPGAQTVLGKFKKGVIYLTREELEVLKVSAIEAAKIIKYYERYVILSYAEKIDGILKRDCNARG